MRPFVLLLFAISILPLQAQHAAIAADKMNVFYIGMDNPITVVAEGLKCDDIMVKCIDGNCVIRQNEDSKCQYSVQVKTPGSLKLGVFKKGDTITPIETHTFRVKRIPDPISTVGGKYKGGIIPKNVLKAQKGLVLYMEGFDFDAHHRIFSFTMQTCSDGNVVESYVEGPLFSDRMKELIAKTNSGDVILFDNIKGSGSDGSIRKYFPITFVINGYTNKRCPNGKISTPFTPTFYKLEDENAYAIKENILNGVDFNCACDCVDKIDGTFDNNRHKTGWWYYMNTTGSGWDTTRKEYYVGDTIYQYFYTAGKLTRQRGYLRNMPFGNYAEYHITGKPKVEGQYHLKLEPDTTTIIDPITLEEVLQVNYYETTAKDKTWRYYSPDGVLVKEEEYDGGRLVREKNF